MPSVYGNFGTLGRFPFIQKCEFICFWNVKHKINEIKVLETFVNL